MKECPQCSNKLSLITLDASLPAMQCSKCQGHWISASNYTRWLENKKGIEPELPAHQGQDITYTQEETAHLCPECQHLMIKARVRRELSYSVDRCPSCNSIWLDHEEWESLKSRNLHDEIYFMFTSLWRKKPAAE